jgi:hypothetical protein
MPPPVGPVSAAVTDTNAASTASPAGGAPCHVAAVAIAPSVPFAAVAAGAGLLGPMAASAPSLAPAASAQGATAGALGRVSAPTASGTSSLGSMGGPPAGSRRLASWGGRHGADDDGAPTALDAAARHAAQLAPPQAGAPGFELPPAMAAGAPPAAGGAGASAGVPAPAAAVLEVLMAGMVRKVAWSGDGRRGALRLELASGALAGATVLVQAVGGRVDVTLGSSPGSAHSRDELEAWRGRIAARLAARGIEVGAVEVV